MKRFFRGVVAMPLLLLATGCANAVFGNTYSLASVETPQNLDPGIPLAIIVDYVNVPEAVDRPQLVVRINQSQRIVEAARWSEPLRIQIADVIAVDMQRLFRDARVSTAPQTTDRPTIRLAINVQTFDSSPGAGAALVVEWSILTPDSKRVLNGRTFVAQRVDVDGYDALVDAQSRALAAVCVDMADAIMSAIKEKQRATGRTIDAKHNAADRRATLRAS